MASGGWALAVEVPTFAAIEAERQTRPKLRRRSGVRGGRQFDGECAKLLGAEVGVNGIWAFSVPECGEPYFDFSLRSGGVCDIGMFLGVDLVLPA